MRHWSCDLPSLVGAQTCTSGLRPYPTARWCDGQLIVGEGQRLQCSLGLQSHAFPRQGRLQHLYPPAVRGLLQKALEEPQRRICDGRGLLVELGHQVLVTGLQLTARPPLHLALICSGKKNLMILNKSGPIRAGYATAFSSQTESPKTEDLGGLALAPGYKPDKHRGCWSLVWRINWLEFCCAQRQWPSKRAAACAAGQGYPTRPKGAVCSQQDHEAVLALVPEVSM